MARKPFEELPPDEQYVALALAADHLTPSHAIVFSFFGPRTLRSYAREWEKRGMEAVIAELDRLEASPLSAVEETPPFFRRTYLRSQITSLKALLEIDGIKISGEKLADAVRRVLGLVPPPPYDLEGIRAEEARILGQLGYASYADFQTRRGEPAPARISDRQLRRWITELEDAFLSDIAPHMLLNDAMAEALDRSHIRIRAPAEGEPPDYYVYHGRWRGTMGMGEDYRRTRLAAMRTIMHELCPGHHISSLYREALYDLGLLGAEATVELIYSSETPLAEGVAETALFFLSSLDNRFLDHVRAATAREHFSKKILYNAWHGLYVSQTMAPEGARALLVGAGGFEGEKIDRWLAFIDGWRVYYPAYPVGTERIKAILTGDPAEDLRHLYTPKSLPSLEVLLRWRDGDGQSCHRRPSAGATGKGGHREEKDCSAADVPDDHLGRAS